MARSKGVCIRRVRARINPRRRGVDVEGDAACDGLAGCHRRCRTPRDVDAMGDVADGLGVDVEPGGGVSTAGVRRRANSSEGDGCKGGVVDVVVPER